MDGKDWERKTVNNGSISISFPNNGEGLKNFLKYQVY